MKTTKAGMRDRMGEGPWGLRPLPRDFSYYERRSTDRAGHVRAGRKRKGKVVAEVGEIDSYPWGDFLKLIQVLQYNEDSRAHLKTDVYLRLTYYGRDPGASEEPWHFFGQTSLILPRRMFKSLLAKAEAAGIL